MKTIRERINKLRNNLPQQSNVVIGEVVRVHIKEGIYVKGEIQMSALKALGRPGGDKYCRTTDIFEMKKP
jgi:flavin reductase (DIM6/NTAB) family NADH-FMN oxidoreductase RutF